MFYYSINSIILEIMDSNAKERLYLDINNAISSLEDRSIRNTLELLEQIRLNIQNNNY